MEDTTPAEMKASQFLKKFIVAEAFFNTSPEFIQNLSGIISHMGVTLIRMIVWIYEIGLRAFALAFASYISMFVHLSFVRYILYSMLQVAYCTEIQLYYSN